MLRFTVLQILLGIHGFILHHEVFRVQQNTVDGETQEFIGQNGLGWADDVKAYLNDPEIDRILKQVSELTDADVYCEWNCGDTIEDCTGYKCWER